MNFSYKDLEQIDDEIKGLNKDFKNFYKHKKYIYSINKKIIELRKSFLENEDIKYFLEKLYKCENNVNRAKDSIESYQKQDDFKCLLEIQQNIILQIKSDLEILKENDIYSIDKNIFKNRVLRNLKILRVLKDQKELVKQHIKSKSIDEQKSLKMLFLKNEGIIYETYKSFSGKLYTNFDKRYIEHINKTMQLDIFKAYKWVTNNLVLSFWLCVFFGCIFLSFYFINIGFPPQVNITEITPLLFYTGLIGCFTILIIVGSIYISSFLIFKTNTNKKWLQRFFILIQIYLFIVLCVPFIHFLPSFTQFVINYLDYVLLVYMVLLTIYFYFSVHKTKNLKDEFNLFFIVLLIFDIFFMLVVWIKYQDINFIFLSYPYMVFLFSRMIAFSRIFEYKILLCFSLFFGLITMILWSSSFVEMIKLANYKGNFTIKNEFINKEILNKIPICIKGYDEACVDEKMSDENKTTINNLLVKVKFDDRYYFIANLPKNEFNINKEHIKKDKYENLTDISQRMFEIFKVKSCEQSPDTPCYVENTKENNITVKNYYKGFENIQNKNNKYFIEFKTKKENILN